MHEYQRPLPLTVATEPTAVAIRNQGRVQVGVALPGNHNLTDLFLAPGYTENTDIATIFSHASVYVPGILGVLNLNDFECEDDIDAARPDYTVAVQALAVQVLDTKLQAQGQRIARPAEMYYSQVGGDDTKEALHLPHDTSDRNWQFKVRVLLAKAQGIGAIELRENQTAQQLTALQARSLPGVPLTADKRPDNVFIVKAYADNVQPRLAVARLRYDSIIRKVVQGAVDGQSTQETIYDAAEVPTKKQWSGA